MRAPFLLAILGLLVQSPYPTVGNAPASNSNSGVVTQWVSHVRNFSSQWTDERWSAKQIVGENDVYPEHGDYPKAWAPRHKGGKAEFIEFEIKDAVIVQSVETFQTYMPGFVVQILAMNPEGQWDQLYAVKAIRPKKAPRIYSPKFQAKSYTTRVFRINMDCSLSKSWCELDAVRVTGILAAKTTTQPTTTTTQPTTTTTQSTTTTTQPTTTTVTTTPATTTTKAPINLCPNATCPILPHLLPCSASPSTPYFECNCTEPGVALCQKAPATPAMIQSVENFLKSNGRDDMANILIQGTGDVNAQVKGRAPLHLACEKGQVDAVKVLLERGARMEDKTTYYGGVLTALMVASHVGQVDVVRVLLDRGARMDANADRAFNEYTPLHFASNARKLDVVKLLVDKGAYVNVKDMNNRTPLWWANQQNYTDIAAFLRSRGGTA